MDGSRKALKIISIILVVYAILLLLLGIVLVVGGSLPGMGSETVTVDDTTLGLGFASITLGIVAIGGALINLIIGLLGLRGAKNPAKIGAFYILAIIGAILNGFSLVSGIIQGSFDPSSLISFVLVLICVFLAHNIKQNAR